MRLPALLLFLFMSINGVTQDILDSKAGQFGQNLEASNVKSFLPVEEAYRLAIDVIDSRHLRLFWQIEPRYYLYKDRFKWTITTQSKKKLSSSAVFAEAIEHEDEYFGKMEVYYRSADISLTIAESTEPLIINITSQGCADAGLCYPPYTQRFAVDMNKANIEALPIAQHGEPFQTISITATDTPPLTTLIYMVLLAFIGGTILNLMPCVFPVLSLKVLGFAQTDAKQQHLHSWIYACGVVTSFVIVALLLITLQKAGSAVGWGFQLQSPVFVILLAYLFVVMGLSLSGTFELGGQWMGLGSSLANQHSLSGSFFTGVLATLVASPCTAPFMGTAIGFAVSQSALTALIIFAALGSGMAAPLVVLSYSSFLRKIMPHPGSWMVIFKQAIAFPLYATAIWLLWVAGRQTGVNGMSIALFGCLLLVLGLWFWHSSRWRKAASAVCFLGALALLGSPLLKAKQDENTLNSIDAYTPQRLQELRSAGRPVFINVTADWCITCIVNERTALSNQQVLDAFTQKNIAYLKADWTNYDAEIAHLLKQYQRTGIPLYLLYPGDSDQEASILPQLLTKTIILAFFDNI